MRQVRDILIGLCITALFLVGCGDSEQAFTGVVNPLPTPVPSKSGVAPGTRFDPSIICDGWQSCAGQREALAVGTHFLELLLAGDEPEAIDLLNAWGDSWSRLYCDPHRISLRCGGESNAQVTEMVEHYIKVFRICRGSQPVFDGGSPQRAERIRPFLYYPHMYDVWLTFSPPCGTRPEQNQSVDRWFICYTGVLRESSVRFFIFRSTTWRTGYPICYTRYGLPF